MKLATTLLASAAVFAFTATAFAQVTPAGKGERKDAESTGTMSGQSKADAAKSAKTSAERKKKTAKTGLAPGTSDPAGSVEPEAAK